MAAGFNQDRTEIDKFGAMADRWWDPKGPLGTLHDINPLRLSYIRRRCRLKNARVLDVGCGGGILSEALAAEGAAVTGIDLGAEPLAAARARSRLERNGPEIRYLRASAEEFSARRPGAFDVVTCMELLEHVPDPAALVAACAALVRPGGDLFFSTLNRTAAAFLLAILAAEHLLRLLPVGTHQYPRFIRPAELQAWGERAGMVHRDTSGYAYLPYIRRCFHVPDRSVNYLMHLGRPERA